MASKMLRTPTKSPNKKKEFCSLCQCPFRVLTIDTPAIHEQKCKFRLSRPRGECPDGINCKESMHAHYWLYSHEVLENYHKDPKSAPITPKRSRSIDQLFQSLHGKNGFSVKTENISASGKNAPSRSLKTLVVDLTDSQTSSEEFSFKSSQSSGKGGAKLVQSRLTFNAKEKSPLQKVSIKAEKCATPQKHKLCKKCTQKTSKRPKMSQKTPEIKVEKPIAENPFSIAASQAAKSPRFSKLRSRQNGSVIQQEDVIDLTDDIDPQALPHALSTDPPQKQQNDVNGTDKPGGETSSKKDNSKASGSSHKNVNEHKRPKVTGELRVTLNDSLAEWLRSPNRRKPMFSQSADKRETLVSSNNDSPTTLSSFSRQIKAKSSNLKNDCNESVKSTKSQPTSQETVDSEDWGVHIPTGPGFAPLSLICPASESLSTHGKLVDSDDEYFTATSDAEEKNGRNTKGTEGTKHQSVNGKVSKKSSKKQLHFEKKKSLSSVIASEEITEKQTGKKVCNSKNNFKRSDEKDFLLPPAPSTDDTHPTEDALPSTSRPSQGKNKKARLGSTKRMLTAKNPNLISASDSKEENGSMPNHNGITDDQSASHDLEADQSDDDDTLNYSLLLGQTQKFTYISAKSSSADDIVPENLGTSEKATNGNSTDCMEPDKNVFNKKEDMETFKKSRQNRAKIPETVQPDPVKIVDRNGNITSKIKVTGTHNKIGQNLVKDAKSMPQYPVNAPHVIPTPAKSSEASAIKLKPSDLNTPNIVTISTKSKSKQGDIGSMLFGMKPKVKAEPKASSENENIQPKQTTFYDKGNYSGPKNKRRCPFYKRVEGTEIAVDAFSYNTVEGIQFYLLSHYHYDHYMGLTKKYWKQKVFCSEITGNLVSQKIGLPEELIVRLPMMEEVLIGNIRVILLEANHCPGAVLFLFKLPNNRVILHTGDFRAEEEMEHYNALQNIRVDILYLDTTYLNPEYQFPLQRDVISAAVGIATAAIEQNPKTMFVVGTYLIGKEKIFAAVAKAIDSTAFVTQEKFRTVQCLMDKELSGLVTKKPEGAKVHVVAMKSLNVNDLKLRLQKYDEYEQLVAIKPTGWTHDKRHPDLSNIRPVVSGPVRIYGLPYSEHSSFEDLRRFVKFLRPRKIIPTVNVGKKEVRDMMSSYLDKWRLGLD